MVTVPSGPKSSAGGRIAGLDTARALAIFLAMLAHCFIHFNVWPQLGDGILFTTVRALTRSATPTFIILFGMMLEIVYLRQLRRGERQACWTRLFTRAIQCYLLYLCVVVAGMIGGYLSPTEGIKSALFLENAYFANILKFYSLGLLAGIVLIEIRVRGGVIALAAVFIGIWLIYPLIQSLPDFPYRLQKLASFLIGAGSETGPAVLQGMSLVILGMYLGNAAAKLVSGEPDKRSQAWRQLGSLGCAVAAAVTILFLALGSETVRDGFTGFDFRRANHPAYYLLGSTLAMTIIGICSLLAARLPGRTLAYVNVFGTSSLFAYAFGNVVLNLLPEYHGGLLPGLVISAVFMLCLYAATAYFKHAVRVHAGAAVPRVRPAAAPLGWMHDFLSRQTVRLAGLFIRQLIPKSPSA